MRVVDLGNDHRNVGSPTVCGVIGNNGDLSLGVSLLKSLDLVLLHINCAKDEADKLCHLLDICRIVDHHALILLRHGSFHLPTGANCLLIGLSCGTGRSCQSSYLKIGVSVKKRQKSLTNHSRCAYNANLHLFHKYIFLSKNISSEYPYISVYI